jgi:hypothetical protein
LFFDLTLPKQLTWAKPAYGSNDLFFDTDIDKALYIVAQVYKSKHNKEYLKFLKKQFSQNQFTSIIDKEVSDTQLLKRWEEVKEAISKSVNNKRQHIPKAYLDIIKT